MNEDDPMVVIAKEVTARLKAASFCMPIDVSRTYKPRFNLKHEKGIKVSVTIGDFEETPLTRGDNQLEVQIDVGLQKRLRSNEDTEEIDPLVKLVRQIRFTLRGKLQGCGASWIGMQTNGLFVADHLLTHKLFTSVNTFVYRQRVPLP